MKITIEDNKGKEEIYDDVYQFAMIGVMSGEKVVIPIFSKSVIHDKEILCALCEALKEKIKNYNDNTTSK